MYWIIDSITNFILNIPTMINNVYVVDITRCFQSKPIAGNDILYDAMEFIADLGVTNLRRKHPRSEQLLWIIINDKVVTTKALWTSICPKYGEWFSRPVTNFCKFING